VTGREADHAARFGVADGICLYNYFNSFPAGPTLYNAGTVQSIAAVAFSAPKNARLAHAHRLYCIAARQLSSGDLFERTRVLLPARLE
jgi:hypothetical protein